MGDVVLVTGISGFLGGHVALQLLEKGYVVRGSVRNLKGADKVRATLAAAGAGISRLEFAALDLTKDDGWDEAMSGVRFVHHVASPFVTRMPEDKMELIRPAVDGTTRALNAAFRAGVERVVLTSSLAAVVYGHGAGRTEPFTAEDWTRPEGSDVTAYNESKTLAEKAAWDVAKEHGREKDLVAINPGMILGPLLDDDPGTSVMLVKRMLDGSTPAAPAMTFGVIDVRDVAALHVGAMTSPDAGGHRYPAAVGSYALLELVGMLRETVPERRSKMPRFQAPDWLVRLVALFDKDLRDNLGEVGIVRRVDASAAEALLGRPFISAKDAVTASARSLIERKLV